MPAVTGTLSPNPFTQFLDDDGRPLASGGLATFSSGTTAPRTTYGDAAQTITNANPVLLDAAGRPTVGTTTAPTNARLNDGRLNYERLGVGGVGPTNLLLGTGQSYKFVLRDGLGVTLATRDHIEAVPVTMVNGYAFNAVQAAPDFSTTSTAWTDLLASGAPVQSTITTRGGAILAKATIPGYVTGTNAAAYFMFNFNGTDTGVTSGVCTATSVQVVTLQWTSLLVAPGTWIVKLRVKVAAAGMTFYSPSGSQAAAVLSLREVQI
jgi:hypothetical protein